MFLASQKKRYNNSFYKIKLFVCLIGITHGENEFVSGPKGITMDFGH